jgi:two-component system OmpR family response regulator
LRTILYVEDDPDIQSVAEMALVDLGGYAVSFCSSGTEALDTLDTWRPDLILLDVMMPGMDGPSTLAAIRADSDLAAIPVVFVTAKIQTQEVRAYQQLGAVDVIAKPFDPMLLASRVQSIWDSIAPA